MASVVALIFQVGTLTTHRFAPTDSCKGATVEYYDDAACSSFAGISELDSYEAQCVESALVSDHKVYQSLLCSTAAEPPVPPNSYLVK
jgi:hypothetical protein